VARAVILGNGRLTVGLNEKGHVHDFYYPYVGLDNLTTSRSIHHKIGIWVDGQFSWTDGDDWQCSVDFSPEALISQVEMKNDNLGVIILLQDFVDHQFDAFCRIIKVRNVNEKKRQIRIFMHQVFEISRAGRADTALYVPGEDYILDYKGRCCLLVSARDSLGRPFDQFAIGNYGIEGKQGTFRDAEDGELSGHPIEHGGVDSVVRFSLDIESNQESRLDYWVIASDSQYNGEIVQAELKRGLDHRIISNQQYWKTWLATGEPRLQKIAPEYQDMARKSLLVIKAHTDDRGGVIASCDSSIYNYGRDYYSYVWPRDAAYAMWPLIRLGYRDEPKKFFEFCRDIITPDGYLMHKYQPDRAIGSTWHPLLHGHRKELAIQEDETALLIVMLSEYYNYLPDEIFMQEMYKKLVIPAANFMCGFIDDQTGLPHASYDLWEEKFTTSTYTTAVTYRALLAAKELAEKFGEPDEANRWESAASQLMAASGVFDNPDSPGFRKGFLLDEDDSLIFDNTLDLSSVYGVMAFGYYKSNEPKKIQEAIEKIESTLSGQSPSGGSPRYMGDNYFRTKEQYPGNPWLITSLWLAQYHIRTHNSDKARHYIDWVIAKKLPSGVLPEQVDPDSGNPLSVTPLVWSHSEFINTVLDLSQIKPAVPSSEEFDE
jgi:GH15 family glucan-1,4-alpha-glucosidase